MADTSVARIGPGLRVVSGASTDDAPTWGELRVRLRMNLAQIGARVDTARARRALADVIEVFDEDTSAGEGLRVALELGVGGLVRLAPLARRAVKQSVILALKLAKQPHRLRRGLEAAFPEIKS